MPIGIGTAIMVAVSAAGKMNSSTVNYWAKEENYAAADIVRKSNRKLAFERQKANNLLELLGKQKVEILSSSVKDFVDTFSKIKHVNLTNSANIMQQLGEDTGYLDIDDYRKMSSYASQLVKNAVLFVSTDVMLAFGAIGAAKIIAKVGSAVGKSLTSIAGTNATLTFLSGGTIASAAGDIAILGGKLFGPALLVTGFVENLHAYKNRDNAMANLAQAHKVKEQLFAAADECKNIAERAEMFCLILEKLDGLFVKAINRMKEIIELEGKEYNHYSKSSKGEIAAAASIAVTVKSIIDADIIEEDGKLTEQSGEIEEASNNFICSYTGNEKERVSLISESLNKNREESASPVSDSQNGNKKESASSVSKFQNGNKKETSGVMGIWARNSEFKETDNLHDLVSNIKHKYNPHFSILARGDFGLDHQDKKVLKYLTLNSNIEEILLIYQHGVIRMNKGFVLTDRYLYDVDSEDNVSLNNIKKISFSDDYIVAVDESGKQHYFLCDVGDSDGRKIAKMLNEIIAEII